MNRANLILLAIAAMLLCGAPIARAECPSSDIDGFARAFSDSIDIQKRLAKFPVTLNYQLYSGASNQTRSRKIVFKNFATLAAALEVPRGGVFPALEEWLGPPKATIWTKIPSRHEALVFVGHTDSDNAWRFDFVSRDGCWLLKAMYIPLREDDVKVNPSGAKRLRTGGRS